MLVNDLILMKCYGFCVVFIKLEHPVLYALEFYNWKPPIH